ncbi:hypothetical protein DENSPDRAFT_843973 [Dentipellis sp. KUC8613]|nr:hypothetical protein DENSPDRAFT_843973 [Dentipellis sp. KUC8613]
MDNLQEGVFIQDFVQHVLGFNRASLQLGNWTYSRRRDLMEEYLDCASEPGRYKPFCSLFEDAYSQLLEHVDLPKHFNLKLCPLGSTRAHGDYNYRKPDIIVVGEGVEKYESDGKLLFKEIPLCMEFKKNFKPSQKQREETKRLRAGSFSSELVNSLQSKRKMDSGIEDRGKQARVTTQTDDEAQVKGKQLTADKQQLAHYALESLYNIGNRRFIIGIFVKDLTLSLWYFDRIGVIKSEELYFLLEPELFMFIVAAVYSCDSEHLGYEPLPQPPDRDGWPFSSIKDSTLTLPCYSTSDLQDVDAPVTFIVSGEALHTQYGIVGRGTVVLPIRLSPGSSCEGLNVDRHYTAKFSWPVHTRVAEDDLIRRIRTAAGPRWQRHIPDLKLSLTIERASNKLAFLPRAYLKSLTGPAPETRFLRILITPRYRRLRDVQSLEHFKKVFVDVVRVHRVVFLKANVLYRDLSLANIMFRRDKKKHASGVLNDWDLGEVVPANQEDHIATSRHRTGTLPFMVMELLSEDPPVHIYRHDLESFFWILMWAALHLELDGKERPINPLVDPWTQGSWDMMASAKQQVIGSKFLEYISAITPAFQPLVDEWIWPLRRLFSSYDEARQARERRALEVLDPSLSGTTNRKITEIMEGDDYDGGFTDDEDEDFSFEDEDSGSREDQARKSRTPKDLNGPQNAGKLKLDLPPWNQPDTADGTVTYEKFMDALGV